MDSPSMPHAPAQPSVPQPTATLNTPGLPHAPEKLLSSPPARAEHAGGHKTSWGALAGIVIILIVLIVGALYFWGAKLAEDERGSFIPDEASASGTAQ